MGAFLYLKDVRLRRTQPPSMRPPGGPAEELLQPDDVEVRQVPAAQRVEALVLAVAVAIGGEPPRQREHVEGQQAEALRRMARQHPPELRSAKRQLQRGDDGEDHRGHGHRAHRDAPPSPPRRETTTKGAPGRQ